MLINGDCLNMMKLIPDNFIDLILVDPPYGVIVAKWDKIIDIDKMWEQYKRIIKVNGAILIFGMEPFSSLLRCSNLKMYRYDWIWIKDKARNHLNCKKQPMRKYENIMVFYKKRCCYNPQIKLKELKNIRPETKKRNNSELYNKINKESKREIPINMTYPNNVLYFNGEQKPIHPTQKPIELLKYLIKTYSNEGDLVFDNCMGSGSTCLAAKETNRKFVGIEIKKRFFDVAKERI